MSAHTVPGAGSPPVFEGPPVVQDAPPVSSITIKGVPASVSRETACGLIEALGLDPYELISLRFDLKGIHVEVYATDPDGRRFTHDRVELATHRMTIPIIDEPKTDSGS